MKLFYRICLFVVLCFLSTTMWAQGGTQGTIEGFVTDQTGAVVRGANVTATDTAKGVVLNATTGENGTFTLPAVQVGTYEVKVEHAGFAAVDFKDVQVAVGAKINLPVTMPVEGVTQQVEVTTEAPVVDTTRTTVSESVNERQVANLPVLGRNFLEFTLLTPGVTRDVRGGDLSFAGQRGTLNSLTIDGADNNNTFFGQTLGRTGSGRAPYQFSQDAVQEFQVLTSGYAPEYGRAGGAVINVVTKSGTNQFHGTGFEFFRDRGLNANDQFYSQQLAFSRQGLRPAPLKPGYHFNQFGGNVGGPVLKDRVFFFFDYDGQRNAVGVPISLNLPTPTDAAQTAAVQYLTARGNTYLTTFNQDVYLGKVDWHVGQRNLISGRYNGQRFKGLNLENGGGSSSVEHTGSSNVTTDTFTGEWNFTVTPTLINTLRGSYQRDSEPGFSNSLNPEAVVRNGPASLLTVGRNNFSPRETTLHRQQYTDTLAYVWRSHTFKFGGDYLRDQILNYFPGNFSGAYVFDSLENFGRSLLGQPFTFTPAGSGTISPNGSSSLQLTEAYAGAGASGPTTHPDSTQIAFFVQDDWRVSHRLDLTFGVRYDRQSFHQPGVQNQLALATGFNTAKINVDDLNFGPRVGFAFQPYANSDRTVLRGGAGIFYGVTPSILTGTASSNNGINLQTFVFQPKASTPNFPGAIAYPSNTCGAPQDMPRCAPPAGFAANKSNIYAFSTGYHEPEVIQYNLQIQQQVQKDLSFTVGYLGVRGLRLQRTRDANFTTEAPATISSTNGKLFTYQKINSAALLNANFNHVFLFEGSAHSTYHGLIATIEKRFGAGLQLSGAYTWSHVRDDAPDATAVVFGADDAKLVYDPLRPRFDLGAGNDDVRNRFVFNEVWDLDQYARGMHGLVRQTIGGFAISSIVTAQSGQPYSATINSSLNGSGLTANQRVPGLGRNTLRLPSFYSWDPRVTKTIGAGERVRLLLIGEAFNVLNHSNVTGVFTNQYLVTGGQLAPNASLTQGFQLPRNFGSQRVIQLAAKIQF